MDYSTLPRDASRAGNGPPPVAPIPGSGRCPRGATRASVPAMAALVLVIGNRNYSSWSLRPWLALRAAGLDFAVERIALYQPGFEEKLRRFSATGLVPVLVEDERRGIKKPVARSSVGSGKRRRGR